MDIQQMGQLGQQAEAALAYAAWIGPIGLILLGAALWLGGRRVARPMGVMAAMVVGAGVGLLLTQSRGQGAVMIAGTLGALIAAVLAWALFRIWMAATLAVVLAVAMPLAGMALQGVAPPPLLSMTTPHTDIAPAGSADPDPRDTAEKLAADLVEQLRKAVMAKQTATDQTPASSSRNDEADTLGDEARSILGNWWDRQCAAVDEWRRALPPVQRASAAALAGLGALLGVLLGLIGPYTSAAIQSSLIGGAIAIVGISRLGQLNPDGPLAGLLPQSPVQLVSLLGLITLMGVGIQWTLWRCRADK